MSRDGFTFYLASNTAVLAEVDHDALDVPIAPLDFLRPTPYDWEVQDFLRVYQRLNAVAFGPKGIPMELWVMLDLGLLASALLLITVPRERARAYADDPNQGEESRAQLKAVLGCADELGYRGPVPVAGYCASPTAVPRRWIGWSLCSILPGRALGLVAKALALAVYRARTLIGVAQYDSPALRIHRRFGRMRIAAAVVDLHPVPHTLVYETDLVDPGQAAEPTWLVGSRDAAQQRELQKLLDARTHELQILEPGLSHDGTVPVLATALS